MRPIKLIMRAFGPYSGEEVVDFTELMDKNLFLITGPTGSGKTTIFDGISFAMYGQASGNMRTGESLRSDFVTIDSPTQVELVFELKGIKYKITRSPRQEVLKTRGEGTREMAAEAQLTIFDGTPNTIITKVKAVNEKVEEIVGLNAEQFKQIMMIPQGEFRKLLTADSRDREKILSKLFNTSFYKSVQIRLEEKAAVLHDEIKGKKLIRYHELKRIDAADDIDLIELLNGEDINVSEVTQNTKTLIVKDKAFIDKLSIEIKKLADAIEKKIAEKGKAEANNQSIYNRDNLGSEIKSLEEDREDMDTLQTKIQRAQRAMIIIPVENNFIKRKQDLQKKQDEIKKTIDIYDATQVSEQDAKLLLDEENSPQNIELRQETIANHSTYKSYIPKVGLIESNEKAIDEINDRIIKLLESRDKNEATKNTTKASIGSLKIKIEETRKAEIELARGKIEKINLKISLDKLIKFNDIKSNISVLNDNLKVKKVEKQRSHDNCEELNAGLTANKHSLMNNQAAILASNLKDGQPCPVCGSLEHEGIAITSDIDISQDEIDRQEATLQMQQSVYNRINTEVALIEAEIKGKNGQLTELEIELKGVIDFDSHIDTFIAEMKNKYNMLLTEINELSVLSKTYTQLNGSFSEAENMLEVSEQEKTRIDRQLIEENNSLILNKANLANTLKAVPEEFRKMENLSAVIWQTETRIEKHKSRLQRLTDDYKKLNDKCLTLIATISQINKDIVIDKANLDTAEVEFKKRVINGEFTDISDYNNAKIKEREVISGKQVYDAYIKKLEILNGRYKNLVNITKGLEIVELSQFDEMISELRDENSANQSKHSDIANRITNNSRIIKEVTAINDEIGEREERFRIIGQLARVARGNNKYMISFERYVLASFLDNILLAANDRLKLMTQGRFLLIRSEEVERRGKNSGLDLLVFDNYTGKYRSVKTLSGGQTFMASLSMALGLCDVVQSFAGGVQLDTMFIDEGFGTLDAETLDSAINCLIDLQKSGRLIGIISHVQELKERISTRLEVSSTNTGSSTKFVVM